MAHHRVKIIGSGHYHFYSRLVLGNFLLSERKEKFLHIRPVLSRTKNVKTMAHHRVKIIGSGHYHIYSRLVLGEFLLSERKEKFLEIIEKVAYFSGAEVIAYTITDSHIHLLINVLPVDNLQGNISQTRLNNLHYFKNCDIILCLHF